MSTYTESHKRYYEKQKISGISAKLYRGDKEFLRLLTEAANKIKEQNKKNNV